MELREAAVEARRRRFVQRGMSATAQRGLAETEPREQGGDELDVTSLAAVARGDDGERLVAEPQPFETPAPHDGRRLERLRRRAKKHGRVVVTGARLARA
jgi:hypothetical protein